MSFKLQFWFLASIILSVKGCHGAVFKFEPEGYKHENDQTSQDILRNLKLMSNSDWSESENDLRTGLEHTVGSTKVKAVTWQDCGSTSDWAKVKTFSIGPDPLPIPGNVTVSFSGSLSKSIGQPLQLSLEIKKKMFLWITIPCVDNLGSCDYADVCQMLTMFTCPPAFKKHGIPCLCPVKAGSYSLPSSTIEINPTFGIPSWLENGDYQVTAKLMDGDQEVMCMFVELSLAAT